MIISIDSAQLGGVQSLTLRTDAGEILVFDLSRPVVLDDDSFAPDHLREHMAAVEPITVVYELREGEDVVLRLTDANEASAT